MENNTLNEIMDTTVTKIRQLADANTIVGAPITTDDGVTVIPVSRVSFGFAAGGSDNTGKGITYMGGNGAGVKVDPIGFLVIKDGACRMINISPAPLNTADRVIEMIPDVIDKIEGFIEKRESAKE